MSRRGTTAVAWGIGLGALIAQAVAVGTVAMLQAGDEPPATIEAPKVVPATGPELPEGHEPLITVIARVG
jgi:hypothetical protein